MKTEGTKQGKGLQVDSDGRELTGGKAQGGSGALPWVTWVPAPRGSHSVQRSPSVTGHSGSPGAALPWDNLISGALRSKSGLSTSSAPGAHLAGLESPQQGRHSGSAIFLCQMLPVKTQLFGVTLQPDHNPTSLPTHPILTLNNCASSITTRSWQERISAVGAMIHPPWPIAHTTYGNAFSEIQHAKRETQHVPNQARGSLDDEVGSGCRRAPASLCAWKRHVKPRKVMVADLYPSIPLSCLTWVSCATHTSLLDFLMGNASQKYPQTTMHPLVN